MHKIRFCFLQKLDWSPTDVSFALGVWFGGRAFTEILVGPLIDRIGPKLILSLAQLLGVITTMFAPVIARASYAAFLVRWVEKPFGKWNSHGCKEGALTIKCFDSKLRTYCALQQKLLDGMGTLSESYSSSINLFNTLCTILNLDGQFFITYCST